MTMNTLAEPRSTLGIGWATGYGVGCRGGGATPTAYREFIVDGVPLLSSLPAADLVTPFGTAPRDIQLGAIDRLLRRAPADFPGGRVSLYVCPECGSLGCGAVSLQVDVRDDVVVWRDFAMERDWVAGEGDDPVDRYGFERVGMYTFDRLEYGVVFERLANEARATPDGGSAASASA